jgi:hypothetical protein
MRVVIKKGLWNGMVAINDKFYKELNKNEDMDVILDKEVMTIPEKEFLNRIEMETGPYPDKYGMGYYKLLYFRWSPNKTNQKKLL